MGRGEQDPPSRIDLRPQHRRRARPAHQPATAPQGRQRCGGHDVRRREEGRHPQLASNSTYRSFLDQRSVYDGNLHTLGKTTADRLTAHPGCSEHQTGLAIDIGAASGTCSLNVCMGDGPEGGWLAANAWRYGFLLRYPADKVAVTGYQYEPWHFRYLGTPLATELHRTRTTTLEEFFGLPAAPDYT